VALNPVLVTLESVRKRTNMACPVEVKAGGRAEPQNLPSSPAFIEPPSRSST